MTTPAVPEILNFIDGTWAPGGGEASITVVNPATGELVTTFRDSTTDDVERAVSAARAAAPAWAALTTGERSVLLQRVGDLVSDHLEELLTLEIIDTGKPISATRAEEFPLIRESIRYYAAAARSLTTQTAGRYSPGVTTMFQREPMGVVGAITPWNYPLWMAVWKTVPALVTGNTVVVKPAENTPLSTTRYVELAAEVLPPGVLNLVHGRGATAGVALCEHTDIDMMSFTGSVVTGRAIAHACAERPRRAVLELGGNAPVVILADADIEAAAETVAVMGTYNAGQECMAATRVIVAEQVAGRFTDLLLDALRDIVVGDPLDELTTLGPLVSEEQLTRVLNLLGRRPAHAKVLIGGGRVQRPGFYLEPTVVTGLVQADELVQTEIFAPVVTVQTFRHVNDALAMANGVAFGLSGSVWTEDIEAGLRMTSGLNFGNVWLNTHLVVGLDFSLGGFNESGYGKEGGVAGIEEFTRVKAVGIRSRDGQASA